MTKSPRIPNEDLLEAGLEVMRQDQKPLTKLDSQGRSMMYELANHETVRVRTCNDHILIVLADSPKPDADLNIDGTDWLLVIMPETPRTPGRVKAYLVPTTVAVSAARKAYKEWLGRHPNTKGNTTWNLLFRPNDRARNPENQYRVAEWAQYELKGAASTNSLNLGHSESESPASGSVKDEIESAKVRIATAAGVSVDAVRISIDF